MLLQARLSSQEMAALFVLTSALDQQIHKEIIADSTGKGAY